MITSFFGGAFFGGEFFNAGVAEVAAEPRPPRPADNEKNPRLIFKPTGLPPRRRKPEVRPSVAERVEIAKEVRAEVLAALPAEQPVDVAAMDAEIAALIREKIRREEKETILMLIASGALH